MKIQFENMRGRPALGGASDQSSASRGGAILPRNSSSSIQLAGASGLTGGGCLPLQEQRQHYSTSYDRDLAAWVFIGLFAAMPFAICAVCFGIIKLFS